MLKIEDHRKEGKIDKILNSFTKSYVILKLQYQKDGLLKFFFSKNGWTFFFKFFKKILSTLGLYKPLFSESEISYQEWRLRNELAMPSAEEQKREYERFEYKPVFSIHIHYSNSKNIEASINSILQQTYENWNLLLSFNHSIKPPIEKDDARIHFIPTDQSVYGEIIKNVLTKINGDYTLLLFEGDELAPETLYYVTKALQKNKAELLYSDEDCLSQDNLYSDPYFKPDWNIDNLLSRNYIGQLAIFRTSFIKQYNTSTFKSKEALLYQLCLFASASSANCIHLSKIFYHKKLKEQSENLLKEIAEECRMTLENFLKKENRAANVNTTNINPPQFITRFNINGTPKISIIIPTRNKAELIKQCIDSIIEISTYKNFEIILIDNNSDEESFFELSKKYTQDLKGKYCCYRYEVPFNFSKIINYAAQKATGEYLLLLNNDTKVISSDWMEAMLEQAQQKHIGVVGAKLLYPNNLIQHAGVIIGIGGVATHVFTEQPSDSSLYFNQPNLIGNYSALTAACIMIKKQLFDQVNGFNEAFEVDFNDIDFCLRIKELGYNNIYLPHVTLYHYESISRGNPHKNKESYRRHLKEIQLFKEKWIKYIEHDPCYNDNLSKKNVNFELT